MNPQGLRPTPSGVMFFLLLMFFAVLLYKLVFVTQPNKEVAAKPAVEEVNTVNNRTAYEVARGGTNTVIYKSEVGNTIIYFSNQGGVWGHPK